MMANTPAVPAWTKSPFEGLSLLNTDNILFTYQLKKTDVLHLNTKQNFLNTYFFFIFFGQNINKNNYCKEREKESEKTSEKKTFLFSDLRV